MTHLGRGEISRLSGDREVCHFDLCFPYISIAPEYQYDASVCDLNAFRFGKQLLVGATPTTWPRCEVMGEWGCRRVPLRIFSCYENIPQPMSQKRCVVEQKMTRKPWSRACPKITIPCKFGCGDANLRDRVFCTGCYGHFSENMPDGSSTACKRRRSTNV